MSIFEKWICKRENISQEELNSSEKYKISEPNILFNNEESYISQDSTKDNIENNMYSYMKTIIEQSKEEKNKNMKKKIFLIMKKMGWNEKGLGKNEQGIVSPLKFKLYEKNTFVIVNNND